MQPLVLSSAPSAVTCPRYAQLLAEEIEAVRRQMGDSRFDASKFRLAGHALGETIQVGRVHSGGFTLCESGGY